MESSLPLPVANADSLPYWNAARERRLLIRKCNACGALHFMPRHLCPACWSDQLEWVEAKGTGSVHSFTIIRRAPMAAVRSARCLTCVALIDLDEGPRMMANVLGEDALSVAHRRPRQGDVRGPRRGRHDSAVPARAGLKDQP